MYSCGVLARRQSVDFEAWGSAQRRLLVASWLVLAGLVFDEIAAAPPDYMRDVKPLFEKRCSSCHGRLKQKADLRLDAGAPYPADERAPASPSEHWAFQPVKRAPVPEVKDAAWCRNPIDRFILAKLEAHGWRPASEASSAALLRRTHRAHLARRLAGGTRRPRRS